jgi:hypothetical protein
MPTEFRRIVFSHSELREALASYRSEEQVTLPAGQLRSVRFLDERRDRLVLGMYDPGPDKVVGVEVSTPFVAAALLRYCIARRIPIQRSAQKALTLAGENVALDLRSAPKGEAKPADAIAKAG